MTGTYNYESTGALPPERQYDAYINEALKAFQAKDYPAALKAYKEALKIASAISKGKMIICVLQYMIATCLVESNNLNDLAEAVTLMQTIDESAKKRLAAIFFVLARAHSKLFRFKEGLDAIAKGEEIIKGSHENWLEVFYIPGTNVEIKLDVASQSWKQIKQLCSTPNPPDAVCFFKDCQNITKPYSNPNKDIYLCDPAFNGIITLKCDGKYQCVFVFHECCWLLHKNLLFPQKKVIDKELIGYRCFSENCTNGKIPAKISFIEIVPENRKSSIYILPHENNTPCKSEKENLEKPMNKEKSEFVSEKVDILEEGETKVGDEAEQKKKSELILVVNNEFDGKVSFSHEKKEIALHKEFLLSMFEGYIKKNIVRVCDVYTKYSEYSEHITIPEFDILDFLLSTKKIKIMDNPNEIPQDEYINQEKHKVLKDFLSDEENPKAEDQIKIKTTQLKKNAFDSNISEKSSTGASSLRKQFDEPLKKVHSSSLEECLQQKDIIEKKELENRKLEEYSKSCKVDLDAKILMVEIETLKQELISKESDIKLLNMQMVSKESDIKFLNTQLKDNNERWEVFQAKVENLKQLRQNHEIAKKENIILKNEIINLIKEKRSLEEKLLEMKTWEIQRKKEMKKDFQEDVKLIEERLKLEYKTSVEGQISDITKKEAEKRLALLLDCLNSRYSNYRTYINAHIDFCHNIHDMINKINGWIAKTMDIKNFLNNSEWLQEMSSYSQALNKVQDEYRALMKILLDQESTQKYEMSGIDFKCPELPELPREVAGDYALKALNAFYDRQRLVIQSMHHPPGFTKPLTYPPQQAYANNQPYQPYANNQSHQPYHNSLPHQPYNNPPQQPFSTNYPQLPSTPPPGLLPHPTPFNAYPHVNMPMVLHYKQMQELKKEMQHEMQECLQREMQQMRKKLEQENQVSVSYPESVSSTKSVNADSHASPVQITVIEPELDNNLHQANENNDNHYYPNEDNCKIQYCTGSTTGDDLQAEHTDTEVEEQQEPVPLRKPNSAHYQWKNEETLKDCNKEESTFVQNSNHNLHQWKNQQRQPTPLEKPVVSVEEWEPIDLSNENTYPQPLNSEIKTKQGKESEPNLVMKYLLQDSADEPREKRPNLDSLVNRLKAKYPGTLECDIISIISEIRKRHNNSLRGLTVRQIIEEAEEFFLNNQHLQLVRYLPTETIEVPAGHSVHQQRVRKDSGSSTSYYSVRGPDSARNSVSSPKKAWGLPSDERKWVDDNAMLVM